LLRTIEALERASSAAAADGDIARIVACQRAITQAVALAEKLAPPPPPNPDAKPDMIAAANRFRERVHEILKRAMAAGSE
jgi:hypothetical protein